MRAVNICLIVWMLGCGVFFIIVKPLSAQSNELLQERVLTLQDRMERIERLDVDSRVRVLEDGYEEIRWGWRTVLGVLVVQLIQSVRGRKKQAESNAEV